MLSKTRSKSTSRTAARRSTARGVLADQWSDTMVRRAGAPPLRFKGRALSRVQDGAGILAASITLWLKKSGGFVGVAEAGKASHAASRADLGDMMAWLEEICEAAETAPDTEPLALVPSLAVDRLTGRNLRRLAGRALDEWDRLLEQAE